MKAAVDAAVSMNVNVVSFVMVDEGSVFCVL